MKIYILGLGAGSIDIISKKGYELLKKEDIKKIFRTKEHEIIHELAKENIEFETMDYVYLSEPNFESVYEKYYMLFREVLLLLKILQILL